MVDSVLHENDAHFDVLFNIDVHHHGSYEPCNHHEEVVGRRDQVALSQGVIVELKLEFPDAAQHAQLNELNDQSVLKYI